jgi:hypothetical protein
MTKTATDKAEPKAALFVPIWPIFVQPDGVVKVAAFVPDMFSAMANTAMYRPIGLSVFTERVRLLAVPVAAVVPSKSPENTVPDADAGDAPSVRRVGVRNATPAAAVPNLITRRRS